MTQPASLARQTQAWWASFWQARQPRERRQVMFAVTIAASALFYLLCVAPALAGRTQLTKELPDLRLQAAQMQALTKQAAGFSAAAAPPAALSREAIETGLSRKGLKSQNIAVSGDVVKVQLSSVSFAGLLDWLDDMQKSARVSVVDANIAALAQIDMVNVTLTLRQQRSD